MPKVLVSSPFVSTYHVQRHHWHHWVECTSSVFSFTEMNGLLHVTLMLKELRAFVEPIHGVFLQVASNSMLCGDRSVLTGLPGQSKSRLIGCQCALHCQA